MLEVNSLVGIKSLTRQQKYILLEFYRCDHECILKLSLKLLMGITCMQTGSESTINL
jgi:hypothetical protein